MPPLKRQKINEDNEGRESPSSDDKYDHSLEEEGSSEDDISDGVSHIKKQKSRQTSKRKIRATGTSAFGITLQSLLNTEVPSTLPLSLKPSIARKRNDEKLELRAKKILQVEKKDKEDKGRIIDVIGGWGGESERALRKVAQRGVVKLFNTIQQSQAVALASANDAKATRGSGKPTLRAPVMDDKIKGKYMNKDSFPTKGSEGAANDTFFDMIRSGGIVSRV
ncbi:Rrp15p-domain-containing protein [Collybia nuda]|uniref:Rrp15p-domain-containing protein n=1 Tax=Collybia nuda TaxID=64659 RepID=A0A9P6CIR4_9AGAR|nr:Rrp15p-domain-containing protein [Collybia nuda]